MKVWMRKASATRRLRRRRRCPGQGAGESTDPALLDVAGDGLHRLKVAGEETGNPTSMTSTPSRSSAWAICSFSLTVKLAARACSPSRRVVSNMMTRSDM